MTEMGPRGTLLALRVVTVAHGLSLAAQPMFAGVYLGGEVSALDLHDVNAIFAGILGIAQVVAAVVFVWGGRGRAWPLWWSIVILVVEEAQASLGSMGLLPVHVPLGVSLISGQVLFTVWLFRAAAGAARTPKPARASTATSSTSSSPAGSSMGADGSSAGASGGGRAAS
ncbi:hypothetical protein ACIBHX_03975 [Nonomuraea sp. NPDC050536]|uniref:hypothetical protein n=1 Tax=Nonomuraea sp. NPDC050536 TaxID=3364366 RepID=UPI0037CA98BC